jgi:hypothetical protein
MVNGDILYPGSYIAYCGYNRPILIYFIIIIIIIIVIISIIIIIITIIIMYLQGTESLRS